MRGEINMITVREAKEFGTIPKDYHEIVDDKCKCGADYLISKNRKTIMCSDERCVIKNAYRASEMLNLLGVKGMGFSYCYRMLVQNRFASHIGILVAPAQNHPSELGASDREFNRRQIERALAEPVNFRTMVSKLAIPGLKEQALTVFKGVNSYEDYWNKVKGIKGENPLWSFVGQKMGSYGDLSIGIVRTLVEYDTDIQIAEKVFNIIPDSKKEYKIAVTGRIEREGNMTRDQFESYLRELGKGQVTVRINKALASVDYVVADYPSNSLTYNTGKSRGVLITSDKFCDIIRGEVV